MNCEVGFSVEDGILGVRVTGRVDQRTWRDLISKTATAARENNYLRHLVDYRDAEISLDPRHVVGRIDDYEMAGMLRGSRIALILSHRHRSVAVDAVIQALGEQHYRVLTFHDPVVARLWLLSAGSD